MKRADTVHIGFRVDRRVLKRFDETVKEYAKGKTRADVLRSLMALFAGQAQVSIFDAAQLIETMTKQDAFIRGVREMIEIMGEEPYSDKLTGGGY